MDVSFHSTRLTSTKQVDDEHHVYISRAAVPLLPDKDVSFRPLALTVTTLKHRRMTVLYRCSLLILLTLSDVSSFLLDASQPCHRQRRPPTYSASECNCFCAADSSSSSSSINNHNSNNKSLPRRDFLGLGGMAALSALSVLGLSEEAKVASPSFSSSQSPTIPSASNDPRIPFSSSRKYKTITLSNNGLRVLLVQDVQVFQAAAALSIGGAGQFADPDDVPGLAHLCEHMVLSYASKRKRRTIQSQAQDFEEWLSDQEGSSNAFTALDNVCFHFTCPDASFLEGLERFAGLFEEGVFASVCRNEEILKREIKRVDSELDYNDVSFQATSLSKNFVTPEHPYARFSAGNAETLQELPNAANIDVAERLIQFFRTKYQPSEAILVVTAPQDFVTLQRWVTPFASTLSRQQLRGATVASSNQPILQRFYPGGFLLGTRLKQMVILHKAGTTEGGGGGGGGSKANEATEPLQFEWILNFDYTHAMRNGQPDTTGAQIAFCLAQILGRRGPGSLYAFLLRRGWVPPVSAGVPRITMPVDVSGFQLIKMDMQLTVEGFLQRSAVVAAVYDTLEALRRGTGYSVTRELVTQWASIAKLHGYLLTPRPPDAIELAEDFHIYGLDGPNGIGSGQWYRFPEPDDRNGINLLQKSLSSVLALMSDPGEAVVIASATQKMLALANLPPVATSRRWRTEPLTGCRFLYDDMLGLTSRIEELVLTRVVDREELLRPVLNPLVPVILKEPRPVSSSGASDPRSASDILPLIVRDSAEPNREFRLSSSSSFSREVSQEDSRWTLLEPPVEGKRGLPLPGYPPEPNYRSVFVINLLSSRPARASLREAARGELFKTSFEYSVSDLAELGAPGGLAYDLSFNKYGMRLAFMGVNQNLPSYARRFCRRLVEHPSNLLDGPEFFPPKVLNAAVGSARRFRGFSNQRRNTVVSALRSATAYESAAEGKAFLRSCSAAVCYAEGDWSTTREVLSLQKDLEDIFAPYLSLGRGTNLPALPSLDDLTYKAIWKPRFGLPCTLAGITLISDACGRVPR